MAFLQYLQQAQLFMFGSHWSPLWGAILALMIITFFWDCFIQRPLFLVGLRRVGINVASYATFFVLGHQTDRLVANSLLEFEGATQFFVALWVLIKELKYILNVFKSKGIDVPWILASRTRMFEDAMKGLGPPADHHIDAKIQELKDSIDKLKELQNASEQIVDHVLRMEPGDDTNKGKKETP